MDGRRFDEIAKSLAVGASRRLVLKTLLGGAGAALAGAVAAPRAATRQQRCENDDDCPSSFRCCSSVCRDVPNDPEHCGGCDSPCPSGPSIICCDGLCADAASSRNHCGGCSQGCGEDLCVDGACCPAAAFCAGACCAGGEACLAPAQAGGRGVCCPVRQVCGGACCQTGQECVDDSFLGQVCCPARQICNVGAERTSVLCCEAGTACIPGVTCCPPEKICGPACCARSERCVNGACMFDEVAASSPEPLCVPRRKAGNARRRPALASGQDDPTTCVTDADCCEQGDVCDNGECTEGSESDTGQPVATTSGNCCKCVGKARQCTDTDSKGDCRTYCGVNNDDQIVYSELHTCTKGGPGTTLQCRNKPKPTGASQEPDDLCAEDACTDEAFLTASPLTAAALDLANRADDGWATQETEGCFSGEACLAGGLFGGAPFGEINIPSDLFDFSEIINGYRHKAVRRTATPEAPGDVTDDRFVLFSGQAAAEDFAVYVRSLVPPDAQDRTDEFSFDGLVDSAFAFTYRRPTEDIPDPNAESLTIFARYGAFAVFATATSTSGDADQRFLDRDYAEYLGSFGLPTPNLDLEVLVNDMVYLGLAADLAFAGEFSVLRIDGRTLPRDLESPAAFGFRELTDQGSVHVVRLQQIVGSAVTGLTIPVFVNIEVRELESEQAAIDFVTGSAARVQTYFGPALTVFPITEFDALGDQGAGYIFGLNQESGAFNGGVTGYARLGPLVGVVNVNIRTDTPPTPDLLGLVQDGRFFANPGVAILDRQIDIWQRQLRETVFLVDEVF